MRKKKAKGAKARKSKINIVYWKGELQKYVSRLIWLEDKPGLMWTLKGKLEVEMGGPVGMGISVLTTGAVSERKKRIEIEVSDACKLV